jgi:Transposase, Mutator family
VATLPVTSSCASPLRKGAFFPSIVEPRRGIDEVLYAVVIEASVNGVSTRSVDDLVGALGRHLPPRPQRRVASDIDGGRDLIATGITPPANVKSSVSTSATAKVIAS